MSNDDQKNVATPQSLPADFGAQADEDTKRHKQADGADQSGELDPLGEDQSNEPLDIDEAREKMGVDQVIKDNS